MLNNCRGRGKTKGKEEKGSQGISPNYRANTACFVFVFSMRKTHFIKLLLWYHKMNFFYAIFQCLLLKGET